MALKAVYRVRVSTVGSRRRAAAGSSRCRRSGVAGAGVELPVLQHDVALAEVRDCRDLAGRVIGYVERAGDDLAVLAVHDVVAQWSRNHRDERIGGGAIVE